MSYTLARFDLVDGRSLWLPEYNVEEQIATGEADSAWTDLPGGGAFDGYATDRAPSGIVGSQHRGFYAFDTPAQLDTAVNALLAAQGETGKLWRVRESIGEYQWTWARLRWVGAGRRNEHLSHLPVTTAWERQPVWYGTRHGATKALDSGLILDSSDTLDDVSDQWALAPGANLPIPVTNGGNLPVRNAVVKITAGSSAITSVTVACGLAKWTWTGTLAAGTALVIDTGAQSVTNNGVAAYSGFILDPSPTTGHRMDDWLRLAPGANTVTVSIEGGGASPTVLFEFYDHWS